MENTGGTEEKNIPGGGPDGNELLGFWIGVAVDRDIGAGKTNLRIGWKFSFYMVSLKCVLGS